MSYQKYDNLIYNEDNEDSSMSISQSRNNKNLFKIQINSNLDCYDLKQLYLQVIDNGKNPLLIESEVMDEYAPTCIALLEKYYVKEKPLSALYMR